MWTYFWNDKFYALEVPRVLPATGICFHTLLLYWRSDGVWNRHWGSLFGTQSNCCWTKSSLWPKKICFSALFKWWVWTTLPYRFPSSSAFTSSPGFPLNILFFFVNVFLQTNKALTLNHFLVLRFSDLASVSPAMSLADHCRLVFFSIFQLIFFFIDTPGEQQLAIYQHRSVSTENRIAKNRQKPAPCTVAI